MDQHFFIGVCLGIILTCLLSAGLLVATLVKMPDLE